MINLILSLNFLLIIIFIAILMVYILIFYIIIFNSNNLNEKVGELTIKDTMKQKWNNIKIIFKFMKMI
jgi:hypothetical protein